MSSQPTSVGHHPEITHTPSGITQPEVLQHPAYDKRCGHLDFKQSGFDTDAEVADDGRVNINIKEHGRRLSQLLNPVFVAQSSHTHHVQTSLARIDQGLPVPRLNIVIQIVGSRGDVQPFVALGRELKHIYGHRVRLATHPNFREFVQEHDLEFFSIGGDPVELMAFMVKNPGLMPGFDAMRNGDIGKRRKEIAEIISGCWRSCFEAGDGTGVPVTDANFDATQIEGEKPFVAHAIIANPPSFAHIHCAEKLGIPLHLMFTMPWSPTQAFHHPLANIQFSNAEVGVANFVSYALVELMAWQGLGDVINRFRERSLGLEPMGIMSAPGVLPRLRIPYTFCWSPALIPKPKDWGPHIDVSGFFSLPLASTYTPPNDLAKFLEAGPPPVYIGFGSIVLENPNAMTELIFDAVKLTEQRALVSKGWGGFDAEEFRIPEGIFMIGNCPHDWLFKRVNCVVHHGGAGTTAAGIYLGKPTVVVPFFGDQPFWGSMVANAGAGPKPIPHKELTAANLAAAIIAALEPGAKCQAEELGTRIRHENGVAEGTKSFHKQLHINSLRCMLIPSRPAEWFVKHTNIRLSSLAVTTLANEGILDLSDLKLYRPREYDTEPGPRDPITGGATALIETLGDFTVGFADIPAEILKAMTGPRAKGKSKSGSTSPKIAAQRFSTNATSPLVEASATTLSTAETASDPGTVVAVGEESPENGNGLTSNSACPERETSIGEAKTPECHNIPTADIISAGHAATKFINLGLKSPMNFTLGVSKGFHNAPKLYGDKTVREPPKVTGFHSGIRAAGKELGYGLYDGITGLVTQPLAGRKDGVGGVMKGFGKGIGGLILKPGAGSYSFLEFLDGCDSDSSSVGFFAVTGYTMSGVYKEIQKRLGTSVENYIIASRSIEGYEEWRRSTKVERETVIQSWYSLSNNPAVKGRKSTFSSESETSSRRIFDPTHLPLHTCEATRDTTSSGDGNLPSEGLFQRFRSTRQKKRHSIHQTIYRPHRDLSPSASGEIEQAILDSVEQSSTGNSEEDMMIERAIRASIAELQAAEADEKDEQEAYARAISASIEEASRVRQDQAHGNDLRDTRHGVTNLEGSSTADPSRHDAYCDEGSDLERTLAESI
ncbi:hypothetical protein ACO22_06297 [Paracoccidioides brasiliensis]|uniref:Uncharacterized protein n=1 Tax=Paracoccidioides brasiliensis TaxID=121759 RepID=A0A1D2J7Z5_PARBR|nr:hypothetical protein ACO22_06297 [Paracoccidioides brasiliensis]